MPIRTPQDPEPALPVVADAEIVVFAAAEPPAPDSFAIPSFSLRFTPADLEAALAPPVSAIGHRDRDMTVLTVAGQATVPVRITLDTAGRPTVEAGQPIPVKGIASGIERVDVSGLIDTAVIVLWAPRRSTGSR